MEKFDRTYQPHVLADGAQMEFPFKGNFVRMVTSTGLLKLGLDDGPMVAFPSGGKWKPVGDFSKVRVRNDTGGSVSFTIALAYGEFDIDEVTLTGGVSIKAGSGHSDQADFSAAAASTTSILAANANRREAWIKNLSASVTLRWGTSLGGAARGQEIEPGETHIISSQGEIYIYNPDAAPVAVSRVEIEV